MELSLLQLTAALIAVFFGALTQGLLGFGLAVVAAPILYFIDPAFVPGPAIMMSLGIGLLSMMRYHQTMSLHSIRYALFGRVPGSIIGALLLTLVTPQSMAAVLGAAVLLAVLVSLTRYRFQATPKALFSAGFCSGIMGTAASIGGPPMALVMMNEEVNKIRADLSLYFVISCIISLALLAATKMLSFHELLIGIYLIPAVLAGNWVAGLIADKVNSKMMRLALLLLCTLSGVSTLAAALH